MTNGLPTGPRLRGASVHPLALSRAQVDRLYSLLVCHYDHTPREAFERDLYEKDNVILIRDEATGGIRGFSTQQLMSAELDGTVVRAVFSGDTIIDRSCWGSQELVKAFARYCGAVEASLGGKPLYWFLISKGYRTYLYLPLFFREYFPRLDAPTPEFEQSVLDTVATMKFGDCFSRKTGLIEFPTSQGQLKPELAEVPKGRADDPRVRFFLERNPRYAEGVELACIGRLTPANLRGLCRKPYIEGMGEALPPVPLAGPVVLRSRRPAESLWSHA